MAQFDDSRRQRAEVQVSIRSSYSEKIFYETRKFNVLSQKKYYSALFITGDVTVAIPNSDWRFLSFKILKML